MFRAGIFDRYNFTFAQCGDVKDAAVLDIGCGSGRASIEFAKRGARRVVGIDFAPAMIDYSQYMAEQFNVGRRCEFICNDFVSYPFNEEFTIVVALGLSQCLPLLFALLYGASNGLTTIARGILQRARDSR